MTRQRSIILAAHGGGDDTRINAEVRSLAAALEQRLDDIQVIAAFHCGKPGFDEAARQVRGREVLVIPIMTSEGYYARRVLLPRIRESLRGHGGSLHVARALGTRVEIVNWFADRARHRLERRHSDRSDAAILVVGHGTPRHPHSAETTMRAADAIASAVAVPTHAAFLDQEPTIENVAASLQSRHIIVVPFMIGGGDHAETDIQQRLGLDQQKLSTNGQHEYHFTEPLLECDDLIEILCTIAKDHFTHAARPARIGTRGSALARYQTSLLASAIAEHFAIDTDVREIDTTGDRDHSCAIADLGVDDPFTREINAALVNGEIDLAVHSLKDLPLRTDPRIESVAFLPRSSVHEVLVSQSGFTLRDLPTGARVGTSSARRAAQLHAIRPDVRAVTIRGAVPDRVQAVHDGAFDAVILAAAGLERLNLLANVTEHLSLDEFLPAPGQAAIVVQAAADSAWANRLCGIDDPATRSAVRTELTFAQRVDHLDGMVAAAHATVLNGQIRLHARLINTHDQHMRDTIVHGDDAHDVGHIAADELLAHMTVAGGAA